MGSTPSSKASPPTRPHQQLESFSLTTFTPLNQGYVAVLRECGLFVLADGLGAVAAAQRASRMAVECACEVMATPREDESPGCRPPAPEPTPALLVEAMQLASRRLWFATDDPPGTTVTSFVGALFVPGSIAIAHVGDCRAYRLREHRLEQLTHDHSLLNDWLRAELIPAEDGDASPPAALITRALGLEPQVEVDLWTDSPAPGDVYLLCSSGLSVILEAWELEAILVVERTLRHTAHQLVQRAIQLSGSDTLTLALIRVLDVGEGSRRDESDTPSADSLG